MSLSKVIVVGQFVASIFFAPTASANIIGNLCVLMGGANQTGGTTRIRTQKVHADRLLQAIRSGKTTQLNLKEPDGIMRALTQLGFVRLQQRGYTEDIDYIFDFDLNGQRAHLIVTLKYELDIRREPIYETVNPQGGKLVYGWRESSRQKTFRGFQFQFVAATGQKFYQSNDGNSLAPQLATYSLPALFELQKLANDLTRQELKTFSTANFSRFSGSIYDVDTFGWTDVNYSNDYSYFSTEATEPVGLTRTGDGQSILYLSYLIHVLSLNSTELLALRESTPQYVRYHGLGGSSGIKYDEDQPYAEAPHK